MTLVPDGLAVSSGWAANSGTIDHALSTNNGDTTYAEAGTDTETCTLTFTAPPVAQVDIDRIISVQFLTYGRYPARGSGGTNVDFEYETGIASGIGETINYPNFALHVSRNGTIRTQNIGGSIWSYGNLEGIELKLTKNGAASPDVRITMVNLLVTYNEVADDAIFFGHNF